METMFKVQIFTMPLILILQRVHFEKTTPHMTFGMVHNQ